MIDSLQPARPGLYSPSLNVCSLTDSQFLLTQHVGTGSITFSLYDCKISSKLSNQYAKYMQRSQLGKSCCVLKWNFVFIFKGGFRTHSFIGNVSEF